MADQEDDELLLLKEPVAVPEHVRERITAAVARYAAFHHRPIDDELLLTMAADVFVASGFLCKGMHEETAAEFTKAFTKLTCNILRDLVQHGRVVTDTVLVYGRRVCGMGAATNEKWQKFAALCERATLAIRHDA
jgi:hypothetical protein